MKSNFQKQFLGTICGMLVRSIMLKRHIADKHMEDHEKPFQCKICPKGFTSKQSYTEQDFKDEQKIRSLFEKIPGEAQEEEESCF